MKYRISIVLLISVLSGFVWMACDKIDNPLVIVDQQNIPVNISDTVYFVDSVVVTEKAGLARRFYRSFMRKLPRSSYHGPRTCRLTRP